MHSVRLLIRMPIVMPVHSAIANADAIRIFIGTGIDVCVAVIVAAKIVVSVAFHITVSCGVGDALGFFHAGRLRARHVCSRHHRVCVRAMPERVPLRRPWGCSGARDVRSWSVLGVKLARRR